MRISYFAYELGQFVRCQDIVAHKLTIDSSQFGGISRAGGMGGEMMGMPGEPFMGPMGPGELVPPPMEALLAGDSAEREWGVPGQQQPRQEVKKEFEAEADITLTIIKSG